MIDSCFKEVWQNQELFYNDCYPVWAWPRCRRFTLLVQKKGAILGATVRKGRKKESEKGRKSKQGNKTEQDWRKKDRQRKVI